MMTCVEGYTCICEHLECSPSKRTAEALVIFRQFRGIFEETDKMMQDPVLQDICRRLPEIHFGRILPLDTKPVETVRKEYLRRSGKDLSEFLCHIAYISFLRKDLEEARRNADGKAKAGEKTAEALCRRSDSSGGV
ncbi:MAG TPA: hypothetical protein O0X42_00630 [Methanocorpusculum sp.]|nr:hypothetical protein [Methanocorpusculum sp.]